MHIQGTTRLTCVKKMKRKTSFITPYGTYCYVKMPFGLKNAGATFQRLMQKTFNPQIGRNLEAYVDDLVVKSVNVSDHVHDLQETFNNLRRHNLKLNPEKCVFRVSAGKLLGFLVSARGIEANPVKIAAIDQMRPPTTKKEVQKLTCYMAALSHFIARLGEKGLPFFKLLRKHESFEWTKEANDAFEELKKYLTSTLVLESPRPDETLLIYVAATPQTVSGVLVVEQANIQRPVYYVSEVLHGPKERYRQVQKLLYDLLMFSRKLRHYFQAHKVVVPTGYPFGQVHGNRESSGRIAKWAVELGAFDLHFIS